MSFLLLWSAYSFISGFSCFLLVVLFLLFFLASACAAAGPEDRVSLAAVVDLDIPAEGSLGESEGILRARWAIDIVSGSFYLGRGWVPEFQQRPCCYWESSDI